MTQSSSNSQAWKNKTLGWKATLTQRISLELRVMTFLSLKWFHFLFGLEASVYRSFCCVSVFVIYESQTFLPARLPFPSPTHEENLSHHSLVLFPSDEQLLIWRLSCLLIVLILIRWMLFFIVSFCSLNIFLLKVAFADSDGAWSERHFVHPRSY